MQLLLADSIKSKALLYSSLCLLYHSRTNRPHTESYDFRFHLFLQALTNWAYTLFGRVFCACTLVLDESFTNFLLLRLSYDTRAFLIGMCSVYKHHVFHPPPGSLHSLCNVCRVFREFGRVFVWFIHGKCFRFSYVTEATVTVFLGKGIFPGIRNVLSVIVWRQIV